MSIYESNCLHGELCVLSVYVMKTLIFVVFRNSVLIRHRSHLILREDWVDITCELSSYNLCN